MTRCPQCLTDSMRPDALACGRGWLTCTHCGGTWMPGSKMRYECVNCGRKRCPWQKYGPAHRDRWKPIPHSRDWIQQVMFDEEETPAAG